MLFLATWEKELESGIEDGPENVWECKDIIRYTVVRVYPVTIGCTSSIELKTKTNPSDNIQCKSVPSRLLNNR
jgi:hypothetical protein